MIKGLRDVNFMGAISTIMEKLSEKATDLVCDKFKETLTNKELKDKFKKASQKYFDEIFENCDLSGEFDFKEVESYLINNFDNKIIAIFYEVKNIGSKGRDSIRENILRGAVKRGNGNEEAIRKYCNAIIDFVGACLYDKISDNNKQLASEITAVTNEYYKHLVNEMGDLRDIELKILNEIRYFGSFAEQIDNLGLPKVITTNKFSFANPNMGFYGRYDEQKEIEKFMSDNRLLLFWSITGRGGVGKSKFALHLCKKYEQENWKSVWLNKDIIENLNRISRNDRYNKPLLFICDYAGEYIESIKTFLLNISCRTQNKIRLLLLERSGYNQYSNNDYFTCYDTWYTHLSSGHSSDEIKETEYCTNSLNLDNYVLDDEDMFSMLDDFSSKKLSEINKKEIVAFVKTSLNSVSEEDNYLHSEERCLFVLFTADAFLHENDYKCWDTKTLIDQYIKRFKRSLAVQYDKSICSTAYIILAIATAIGTISFENIDYDDVFDYYINLIKDKLNYNIDIHNVILFLSILCEKETLNLNVYPMLPDLVGEFFFIDTFSRISSESKYKLYKVFCSEKYKGYFCNFLKRCLNDWHSLDNFKKIIKEIFEFAVKNNYNEFIEENVNNSFFIYLSYYYELIENDLLWLKSVLLSVKNKRRYTEYAYVLANSAVNISNAYTKLKFASQVENDILSVYYTSSIALSYVKILFGFSYKMPYVHEILKITNRIKNKILGFFNTDEIYEEYAKMLVNVSYKVSDANEGLKILNEIQYEVLNVCTTDKVLECYAEVLLNVAFKTTNSDEILIIANQIKDEILSIYNTDKIAECYARALSNATYEMCSVDEILTIANQIKDEILSIHNTDKVALEYTTALSNATYEMYSVDEILTIANKIKNEILSVYSSVEIAREYAGVLIIASDKMHEIDVRLAQIEIIKNEILNTYNSASVAELYVIALYNAIADVKTAEGLHDLSIKIKKILLNYNTDIIVNVYIMVLEYIFEMYPEHEYLLEEIENIRSEYNLTLDEE